MHLFLTILNYIGGGELIDTLDINDICSIELTNYLFNMGMTHLAYYNIFLLYSIIKEVINS